MTNMIRDIADMYEKYGFDISHLDGEQLYKFVEWRADFVREELYELYDAIDQRNPEEVCDALIDIIVVALGTLDLLKIDTAAAWSEVLRANLEKRVGIKDSRPNEFGFPDLVKHEEWKGPDHSGNHGLLSRELGV